MANDFFKNGDKAYSENLNDGLLVGNAFDWTVTVSLPADTGVFPNSSTVVKAKVADVSITPNSNLSIGSTIENNSGSSQVYRLTVYPNFNRYGGFKSISVTASSGDTFYVANKGASTPIDNNLDYSDLSSVPELKVLKEYDIVITIPSNKEVTGLEFVFQSNSASVSASLLQSNVTGLSDSLASKVSVSDIKDNLTSSDSNKPLSAKQGKELKTLVDGKANSTHNHDARYYTETEMNTWTSVTLNSGTSYGTLWVNPTIRLAHLRYYRENYNYSSTNTEITLHSEAIPSDYRPSTNNILASYNTSIVGAVKSNGDITTQTNSTGSKTINFSGMWHY